MKALGFKKHGELEVMEIFDLPIPTPGPDEVLIEIKASSFNHLDIWIRKGWPGLKLSLPHISGSDAAGIIRELGTNVSKLNVGDKVSIDPGITLQEDAFTLRGEASVSPYYAILGEQLPGTHTEYLVVPAKNVLPLPEHISFEVAAACGLVGTTAWRMLIKQAQIQPGQSVLVLGAGGGVNSFAIQLAKAIGCSVYAITGGAEKVAKAKELGVDGIVDYKEDPQWPKTVLKNFQPQGFDIIVDNVGNATLNESLRLVKRGGKIVIVGNTSGPQVTMDLRYLFSKQISLIGSTMGNHLDYINAMDFVFKEKIKPIIDSVLPLTQGIEAMQTLESGAQFGKIVLKA